MCMTDLGRDLARRRVLLVLATSAGGTGRHVGILADALCAAGVHVVVACPPATADKFGFADSRSGYVPVRISGRPHPWHDAQTMATLRRLARPADLVHAHGLRAGLLAGLAAPRRRPLVVTWHNAVLSGGAGARLSGLLERTVARRADISLCVSPDLETRVRALGGKDVRYAPVSAPPTAALRRTRAEVLAELGAGDRPVILTVARLHPQKGYPWLLRAASQLRDRRPVPLFVAVGDGPSESEMLEEIEASALPVRLLGPRDDVPDLLQAADMMVLPSIWEGSPLAAQEALRAGVPFVGTTAGGLPALVGDGGVLVPPRDAPALADAISEILDDPAYAAALRVRALAAASRLPTDACVVAQIGQAYTSLLPDAPEPSS
jgi:glycosyltransferase involved in cell wall biosynthesis